MRHERLWIVLLLAVTCLGGCYYRGSVTGQGTVVVNTPLIIPPPLPPPPGVPPAPEPEPGVGTHLTRPADGEYRGVAQALTNPGQNCPNTIVIANWRVAGNQASFRGFNGTIAPDGGLKMRFGDAYIIGSFRGSHFEGRYWRPYPGCTYVISVDPA